MIVHKQQAGSRITRYKNIGPAILVKVGCNHGHSIALSGKIDAGLLRHVCEGTVAVVAVERMSSGRQPARPAIDRDSLEIAG